MFTASTLENYVNSLPRTHCARLCAGRKTDSCVDHSAARTLHVPLCRQEDRQPCGSQCHTYTARAFVAGRKTDSRVDHSAARTLHVPLCRQEDRQLCESQCRKENDGRRPTSSLAAAPDDLDFSPNYGRVEQTRRGSQKDLHITSSRDVSQETSDLIPPARGQESQFHHPPPPLQQHQASSFVQPQLIGRPQFLPQRPNIQHLINQHAGQQHLKIPQTAAGGQLFPSSDHQSFLTPTQGFLQQGGIGIPGLLLSNPALLQQQTLLQFPLGSTSLQLTQQPTLQLPAQPAPQPALKLVSQSEPQEEYLTSLQPQSQQVTTSPQLEGAPIKNVSESQEEVQLLYVPVETLRQRSQVIHKETNDKRNHLGTTLQHDNLRPESLQNLQPQNTLRQDKREEQKTEIPALQVSPSPSSASQQDYQLQQSQRNYIQAQQLRQLREQQQQQSELSQEDTPPKHKVQHQRRGQQQQQSQAIENYKSQTFKEQNNPTTPNPAPHTPPLSVYMDNDGHAARLADVIMVLKHAKTIAVLDTIGPDSPHVFVGPSNLNTPDGYSKFELPYLSSLESNRVERKVEKFPFFVAPLNFKPPLGYSKIPFPAPHVGSVVVSTATTDRPDAHEKATDVPVKKVNRGRQPNIYSLPADLPPIIPELPTLVNSLQVQNSKNVEIVPEVNPNISTLPPILSVQQQFPSLRQQTSTQRQTFRAQPSTRSPQAIDEPIQTPAQPHITRQTTQNPNIEYVENDQTNSPNQQTQYQNDQTQTTDQPHQTPAYQTQFLSGQTLTAGLQGQNPFQNTQITNQQNQFFNQGVDINGQQDQNIRFYQNQFENKESQVPIRSTPLPKQNRQEPKQNSSPNDGQFQNQDQNNQLFVQPSKSPNFRSQTTEIPSQNQQYVNPQSINLKQTDTTTQTPPQLQYTIEQLRQLLAQHTLTSSRELGQENLHSLIASQQHEYKDQENIQQYSTDKTQEQVQQTEIPVFEEAYTTTATTTTVEPTTFNSFRRQPNRSRQRGRTSYASPTITTTTPTPRRSYSRVRRPLQTRTRPQETQNFIRNQQTLEQTTTTTKIQDIKTYQDDQSQSYPNIPEDSFLSGREQYTALNQEEGVKSILEEVPMQVPRQGSKDFGSSIQNSQFELQTEVSVITNRPTQRQQLLQHDTHRGQQSDIVTTIHTPLQAESSTRGTLSRYHRFRGRQRGQLNDEQFSEQPAIHRQNRPVSSTAPAISIQQPQQSQEFIYDTSLPARQNHYVQSVDVELQTETPTFENSTPINTLPQHSQILHQTPEIKHEQGQDFQADLQQFQHTIISPAAVSEQDYQTAGVIVNEQIPIQEKLPLTSTIAPPTPPPPHQLQHQQQLHQQEYGFSTPSNEEATNLRTSLSKYSNVQRGRGRPQSNVVYQESFNVNQAQRTNPQPQIKHTQRNVVSEYNLESATNQQTLSLDQQEPQNEHPVVYSRSKEIVPEVTTVSSIAIDEDTPRSLLTKTRSRTRVRHRSNYRTQDPTKQTIQPQHQNARTPIKINDSTQTANYDNDRQIVTTTTEETYGFIYNTRKPFLGNPTGRLTETPLLNIEGNNEPVGSQEFTSSVQAESLEYATVEPQLEVEITTLNALRGGPRRFNNIPGKETSSRQASTTYTTTESSNKVYTIRPSRRPQIQTKVTSIRGRIRKPTKPTTSTTSTTAPSLETEEPSWARRRPGTNRLPFVRSNEVLENTHQRGGILAQTPRSSLQNYDFQQPLNTRQPIWEQDSTFSLNEAQTTPASLETAGHFRIALTEENKQINPSLWSPQSQNSGFLINFENNQQSYPTYDQDTLGTNVQHSFKGQGDQKVAESKWHNTHYISQLPEDTIPTEQSFTLFTTTELNDLYATTTPPKMEVLRMSDSLTSLSDSIQTTGNLSAIDYSLTEVNTQESWTPTIIYDEIRKEDNNVVDSPEIIKSKEGLVVKKASVKKAGVTGNRRGAWVRVRAKTQRPDLLETAESQNLVTVSNNAIHSGTSKPAPVNFRGVHDDMKSSSEGIKELSTDSSRASHDHNPKRDTTITVYRDDMNITTTGATLGEFEYTSVSPVTKTDTHPNHRSQFDQQFTSQPDTTRTSLQPSGDFWDLSSYVDSFMETIGDLKETSESLPQTTTQQSMETQQGTVEENTWKINSENFSDEQQQTEIVGTKDSTSAKIRLESPTNDFRTDDSDLQVPQSGGSKATTVHNDTNENIASDEGKGSGIIPEIRVSNETSGRVVQQAEIHKDHSTVSTEGKLRSSYVFKSSFRYRPPKTTAQPNKSQEGLINKDDFKTNSVQELSQNRTRPLLPSVPTTYSRFKIGGSTSKIEYNINSKSERDTNEGSSSSPILVNLQFTNDKQKFLKPLKQNAIRKQEHAQLEDNPISDTIQDIIANVESFDSNESRLPEVDFEIEKTKSFGIKSGEVPLQDKLRILGTSTSTEVSHETEICFRGRCVKTKTSPSDQVPVE
uniref:Uncharacterized protein n=1 Tax=Timema douglasi TaxID=61478 RepID=A0A7R8VI86_TIMDO|nr:unnamed protein product [Timema douglasi]